MGEATKPCPSCAEQVQAAAKVCRFCQYDFMTGTGPAAPPPPPRKSGGASMVIVIVLLVGVLGVCGVGILAALLLPAIARATRNAKATSCVNNLAQLWKMEHNYMVMFGGETKSMPSETGGQFWLKLTTTTPPLVDSSMNFFECPLSPNLRSAGTTDYRGPADNVNEYSDGDPVGADKEGNHGPGEGGNVLRKSGDVLTVHEMDPMWSAAGSKTRP